MHQIIPVAEEYSKSKVIVNISAHLLKNGNTERNLLIQRADRAEYSAISSALEFVRLNLHQMLHEAGEVIKSVYFLNDGLASVLAVQPDGKSVEVGVIGKEGFVGFPVVFGFRRVPAGS